MKRVKLIGGTTASENARIGLSREITVDTDTHSLRVHDGITPGGHVIPTEDMIDAFNYRRFNSVGTYSSPGVLPDAVQGTLARFTVTGTYDLPALSAILLVGIPILLQATVAGVNIDTQGADSIIDGGSTVTTIALTQDEIVEIAKRDTSLYVVVNRY